MSFDYDIYISYSKEDNVLPEDAQRGWISNFQKFLEMMLDQISGQKPSILNYGNQEKPSASQLDRVAVMISVVSPHFVNDRDCIEDLEAFSKSTVDNIDIQILGINRIFKVIKSPVNADDLPSKIKDMIGFDLYQVDASTGVVKEFDQFFGHEAERNYWMKLVDLAYEINNVLAKIKKTQSSASKKKVVAEKKTVYLAETGHDLVVQRNIIKRELLRHGYKVLPDQVLPTNLREMEVVIKKEIEECKLSIHLIGDSYGDIPKGSNISIVELQNQIAAERSTMMAARKQKNEVFSRLIWVSPEVKLKNDKQRLFIENLKRDAEVIEGAEILQTPLEDLKNIIREELLGTNNNQLKTTEDIPGQSPKVYVLYDILDKDNAKELTSYIAGEGYNLLLPKFEGELLDIRRHHLQNMVDCDIAIIYFNGVNEQWVKMKILDLLKAPGFGKTKPYLGRAVFATGKAKLSREYYRSFDLKLIESNSTMFSDSIQPFLTNIKITK